MWQWRVASLKTGCGIYGVNFKSGIEMVKKSPAKDLHVIIATSPTILAKELFTNI